MRRVFNRLDLLVVVICVIVLFLVAGSTGKKGRENARRIICANNIRQLLQGLTIFAGENEGKLLNTHGYLPRQVDCDNISSLLDCMGVDVQEPSAGQDIPVPDVFYCPSNKRSGERHFREGGWQFIINPPGYCETGYFFLWAAMWNDYGDDPVEGSGDKKYVKTICVNNPSETELVIDIVMSDMNRTYWPEEEYPYGNFAQIICQGMPPYYYTPDGASHLITDREPAGGNIGFIDEHVEWRPFSQMEKRWEATMGCPIAWW